MADTRAGAEPGTSAADETRAGLFTEAVYVDSAGQASTNPLVLLPPRRVIDLAGLAALVTPPAMELEFMPRSPWRSLTLQRAWPRWPTAQADPAELRDRFSASVEACMADAETVAVFFSGGLDSLAVLLHARAIARRQGRRVVAVTVDLADDTGVRVADLTRGLLAEFAPDCEAVVVGDDPDGLPEPPWRPEGPRLRGLPRLNCAANEAAYHHGAEVLLTGTGGDELFMTRDYLTGALLRAGRWTDLRGYLRDICAYYGPGWGLAREGLAMLGPLAGRHRSFQLYAAVQMPGLADAGPAAVMSPELRPALIADTREWLHDRARRHGRIPWCVALGRDMLYPFDPVPAYGPATECSPYMTAQFSWYAAALPPAATYSAAYRLPYHRHKALVARLLPPGATGRLPAGKQQFANAAERYFARVLAGRRLTGTDCGLFSRNAASWLERDPRLAPVCHAIDVWLEAALTAGATVD